METEHIIDSEITLKSYEHELRLCQQLGGDIERYRRLSFDVFQLEQIRMGLQNGLDVEKYLDPKLSWIQMESIRYTLQSGVDISKYEEEGYDWLQCHEIREGLKDGLDISAFLDTRFLPPQMREIRKGLKEGLDVSYYARLELDWYQMREIRRGMENGIDVNVYANQGYSFPVMRAVRRGLEQGVDLTELAEKGYRGKELREVCRGMVAGHDLREYLEKGYSAAQLVQINSAMEYGLDITPYLSTAFHGPQLQEILKGLKKQLDVSVYAKPEFNWFQMREIRFGMEDKVDVSFYTDSDLSAEQMAEIRKGILAGVDVTKYNKVYYEPEQMAKMRRELQKQVPVIEEKEALMEELDQAGVLDDSVAAAESEAEEDVDMDEFATGIHIFVSDDKMQAFLNLDQPLEGMEYSMEKILRILKWKHVKQGIKTDKIEEALEKKTYGKDIVIAQGRKPVNGKDGEFIFHFRRNLQRKPKILEDGSVDYKDIELFEEVKEGQLLVDYKPATSGSFGYDVFGGMVAPQRGSERVPLHGKGFRVTDDKRQYYSLLTGIIEYREEEGVIEVQNIFTVMGNVDNSTGNIQFDGDIYVMGNVESGFSLQATGNIMVDGHCENCMIRAGKDLVIRKGCQGQDRGVLRAGGDVMGQFFESVQIISEGDVTASYLLNCRVRAAGRLVVEGRRGVIIGGNTCAKMGIRCLGIGNAAETKTTIEVGIDRDDMRSYQALTKSIDKLDSEIKTFEEGVIKLMKQKSQNEKTRGLYARLTKMLYTQKKQRKDLLEERDKKMEMMKKQRGASIESNGRVYPGTILYINSDPFVVNQEYNHVTFTKKANKLDIVS